eukprot:1511628-Pyramimonas_sp.AAC.1
MLGGLVVLDKVALVCSCESLGRQLEADLGPFGVLDATAVNLGRGDAAGRSCRAGKGGMRKCKEMNVQVRRKAKRLKRLRAHFGRKAIKVFTSVPMPGYIYGCEVQGLTGGEVHSLRRVAASAIKPDVARRPLAVLSLIGGRSCLARLGGPCVAMRQGGLASQDQCFSRYLGLGHHSGFLGWGVRQSPVSYYVEERFRTYKCDVYES